VRHINVEKGVTAVALGRDEVCLFHHDRFPEMARAEIAMAVAVRARQDGRRGILRALAWEKTEKRPSASFCRAFEGPVEVIEGGGFGFINHEIFVPPDLIIQTGVTSGDRVRGFALLEKRPKEGEYGWRALTAGKAPGAEAAPGISPRMAPCLGTAP
jgi:hypothetical protein